MIKRFAPMAPPPDITAVYQSSPTAARCVEQALAYHRDKRRP